jgi:hypothetical protein
METATTSLRLHELRVSNFLRLEALTVEAHGHHVSISGKNGSGKTSAVEAIFTALQGRSSKELPEPRHAGRKKAEVTVDLGEYRVRKTWSEQGSKLTVTASDGSTIRKPQELLNGLIGQYSLDPVRFLELRPQDQVDAVLSICQVACPVEQVKEITNEYWHPIGDESADSYLGRLSADDVGLYYVRRRDLGRTCELKRDALKDAHQVLGTLAVPEVFRQISVIDAEIDNLVQAANKRTSLLQEASEARQKYLEANNLLDNLRIDLKRSMASINQLNGTIAHMERDLKSIHAQVASEIVAKSNLEDRIKQGSMITAELYELADTTAGVADACKDPSAQIAELRSERKGVECLQEMVVKRRHQHDQVERLAVEYQEATAEHKRADDMLAKLRELRVNLLNNVDLGVAGLEVGEGELRLDGHSFRQASKAAQVKTACAVAMRQKPRLRLLRIDDGERLDQESWQMVLDLANEYDFQIIRTMVASHQELKVEILDKAQE